jgi:hypothetical protein
MAKEKICPRHGRHERRTCPACAWCSAYPSRVKFEQGCPMCGEPLGGNGGLMWCHNDICLMATTSHPPPRSRRQVKPSDVGLRGSRQ